MCVLVGGFVAVIAELFLKAFCFSFAYCTHLAFHIDSQAAREEVAGLKGKPSANQTNNGASSNAQTVHDSSNLNGHQQIKKQSDAPPSLVKPSSGSSPGLKSSSNASPSTRAIASNSKPNSAKNEKAKSNVLAGQTPGAFAALLGESDDDDEKDSRTGSESEGEEVKEEAKGGSVVKSGGKSTELSSQLQNTVPVRKNANNGSFAALDLHQLQQSSKQAQFDHGAAAFGGDGSDASVMAAEARLAAAEASARMNHPAAFAPSLLAAAAAAAAEAGESSSSTEDATAATVDAGGGLEARLAEATERGRAMGGNTNRSNDSTNQGKESSSNSTGSETASSGNAAAAALVNSKSAGGGKKQRAKLAKWVRQQIVHTDVLGKVFLQARDENHKQHQSAGTREGAPSVETGASHAVGRATTTNSDTDNTSNENRHHRNGSNNHYDSGNEGSDEFVGQRVTLHGLRAKPELNGLGGVVEQWVAQSGRYAVRLLPPNEGGQGIDESLSAAAIAAAPRASVKAANLQFLGPHEALLKGGAAPFTTAAAVAAPTKPEPSLSAVSASSPSSTFIRRTPSPDEVEASLEELAEERMVYASALQRVARSFGVPMKSLEACANECLQVLDRYAGKASNDNHLSHVEETVSLSTTTNTKDRKATNDNESSQQSTENRTAQLAVGSPEAAAAAAAGVPADVRGFARRISAAMSEGTIEGRELLDAVAGASASVASASELSAGYRSKSSSSSSYWPKKDTDRFGWLSDDEVDDDDDDVNVFAPYPRESAGSGRYGGSGGSGAPSRAALRGWERHSAESRALAHSLGMGEADCRQALSMHGGDVDAAARFLLSQPSFQADDVTLAAASSTASTTGGDAAGTAPTSSSTTASNGPRLVLRLPEAGKNSHGEKTVENESIGLSNSDASDFYDVTATPTAATSKAAALSAGSGGSACILLNDPRDVSLARVMQRAEVTGAQLPSGLKIPDQGHWVLEGRAAFNLDAPPLPPLPPRADTRNDDNHHHVDSESSNQTPLNLSNEAVKKHAISPAAAAGAAAAAAAVFAANSGSAARSSPASAPGNASTPNNPSATPETGIISGGSGNSSSGGLGAVVRPLHFPTVGDFGPGNGYDSDTSSGSGGSDHGDDGDRGGGDGGSGGKNPEEGKHSSASRRVGHTVLSVDERLDARLSPSPTVSRTATGGAPESDAAAVSAKAMEAIATKAAPLVGVPAASSSMSSSAAAANARHEFSEHSGGALVAAPLKLRSGNFGPAVSHLHRSNSSSNKSSSFSGKVTYTYAGKNFGTKKWFQDHGGTHADLNRVTAKEDENEEAPVASDAWLDEVLDASLSDVLLPDGATTTTTTTGATTDRAPSDDAKSLPNAATPPRNGSRNRPEVVKTAGADNNYNESSNRAVSPRHDNRSTKDGGCEDVEDELHPPDSPPPLDLSANRGPGASGLLRHASSSSPPPLLSSFPPPVLGRAQRAPSSVPVDEDEGDEKRKKSSAVSPSWSGSAIPTWARQSAPTEESASPQPGATSLRTVSSVEQSEGSEKQGMASPSVPLKDSAAASATVAAKASASKIFGGIDDELRHMTMSPLSNMLDAASLNDPDGDVQWVQKKEEEEEEEEECEGEEQQEVGVFPPRARSAHLPPSPVTKSFTGSFSDGLLCSSPTNGRRAQTTPSASSGDQMSATSSSPGNNKNATYNSSHGNNGYTNQPVLPTQRPPLSKEDQLVASLVHLGIGSLAAERLVEDLGVRELSDFRYLRPDELAAVLEADESSSSSSSSSEESSSSGEDSDHFREDSGRRRHRKDDDDDDDDGDDNEAAQLRQWQEAQLLQLPLRGHGGFGVGLGMPGRPLRIPRSWRHGKANSKESKTNNNRSNNSSSFGLEHQLEAVRRALASRGVVLGEAGPPAPNPDIVLTGRRSSPHSSLRQGAGTSSLSQGASASNSAPVGDATQPALVHQGKAVDAKADPKLPTVRAWTVPTTPGPLPNSSSSLSSSAVGSHIHGSSSGMTSASTPTEAIVGAQMCRARLTKMESLKEKGNNLLLAQKLHVAKDAYSEAIDLGTDYLLRAYPDDEDDDDEESNNGEDKGKARSLVGEADGAVAVATAADDEEVDDEAEEALQHLMAVCLANRSLVSLKLSEAKAALWDAVQAERLSPAYGKAPLRRGAAREALGEWAEASEAYALAAQLDSSLAKAAAHAARRCDAASRAHQPPSQSPTQHTAVAATAAAPDQGFTDRASNPWPKDVEPCDD